MATLRYADQMPGALPEAEGTPDPSPHGSCGECRAPGQAGGRPLGLCHSLSDGRLQGVDSESESLITHLPPATIVRVPQLAVLRQATDRNPGPGARGALA